MYVVELQQQSALPMPGYLGQADIVENERGKATCGPRTRDHNRRLIRELLPGHLRTLPSILAVNGERQDATQETFVRVMAHGVALVFDEGALRYLYRVSTNVCLNMLTKQRMQTRAAAVLAMNATYVRWNDFADREFVLAVLARCGEGEAQVAVMHYVEGMSQVEIAEVLGITRKTVFNRLRKMSRIARTLRSGRGNRSAST
jgi:RNA polymerase sigma-70 factor (ECF subfamily)